MDARERCLFWVRRELELLEFARRTGGYGPVEAARHEELCTFERRLLANRR